MHTKTLLTAFCQLEDPRSRRGIRHLFSGIVVLTLLGMLARIREMEVLVRWATTHWDQLQEPLGFDRDQPPCATTISRTLAQCSVVDLQAALSTWLRDCLADSEGVLAVDGQTAKQGLDENGRPLHMLNAFVHDLQAVVGQWSTGAEKTNEPTLLRHHREELLDTYPMLRLITGDAILMNVPQRYNKHNVKPVEIVVSLCELPVSRVERRLQSRWEGNQENCKVP